MIRGMDTFTPVVATAIQGNIKENHPDKPDDIVQKNDIIPHLKTDAIGIHEQQAVDLSSRAVTDLKTPSRPYPVTYRHSTVCMDNSPRGNFYATYANVADTVKPETVRIGNQELITLDTSQSFVDPSLEGDRKNLERLNFNYLVDFLSKNDEIEYIVDIGCGDGKISLLLQNYLNELKFKIKVIPVDVGNAYANYPDGTRALPINIIAAQEIAGASPATTLFTAIRPFTDERDPTHELVKDVVEGKTDYYLTTLLKNNPGCFVMTTEDLYCSSPHRYIPPEMVYTKHYYAFANSFSREDHDIEPLRKAEAAKINAGDSDLYRLNQLLARFPGKRNIYLFSIPLIRNRLREESPEKPELLWPDNIFNVYLERLTSFKHIRSSVRTRYNLGMKNLESRCWHVYRQDVSALKVASQAAKSN